MQGLACFHNQRQSGSYHDTVLYSTVYENPRIQPRYCTGHHVFAEVPRLYHFRFGKFAKICHLTDDSLLTILYWFPSLSQGDLPLDVLLVVLTERIWTPGSTYPSSA